MKSNKEERMLFREALLKRLKDCNPAHELLDTEEYAAFHNISVKKAEADRRAGIGAPWVKIGATVRYRFSSVLATLENERVNTCKPVLDGSARAAGKKSAAANSKISK